jgi:hypothetical protein
MIRKLRENNKTELVGNISTPISPVDKSSRQKDQQKNSKLNDIVDQMDLTEVYRVFHTATAQYMFFSAAHGISSKIDHILGHKTSLFKYKKIEIMP